MRGRGGEQNGWKRLGTVAKGKSKNSGHFDIQKTSRAAIFVVDEHMCVCMYVCTCIHIYVNVHMHIVHVHEHIWMCVYIYIV